MYDVVVAVPVALGMVESFGQRNKPLPASLRVGGVYALVLARRFGQDAGA